MSFTVHRLAIVPDIISGFADAGYRENKNRRNTDANYSSCADERGRNWYSVCVIPPVFRRGLAIAGMKYVS